MLTADCEESTGVMMKRNIQYAARAASLLSHSLLLLEITVYINLRSFYGSDLADFLLASLRRASIVHNSVIDISISD
jgi:hypothetical protein